jgi:hypothetical protein
MIISSCPQKLLIILSFVTIFVPDSFRFGRTSVLSARFHESSFIFVLLCSVIRAIAPRTTPLPACSSGIRTSAKRRTPKPLSCCVRSLPSRIILDSFSFAVRSLAPRTIPICFSCDFRSMAPRTIPNSFSCDVRSLAPR